MPTIIPPFLLCIFVKPEEGRRLADLSKHLRALGEELHIRFHFIPPQESKASEHPAVTGEVRMMQKYSDDKPVPARYEFFSLRANDGGLVHRS